MGPAFETLLTVLLPIIVVVGGGAYIFRDQIRRVKRSFGAWQARDETIDLEETRLREKAEAELAEASGEVHKIEVDS